MSCRPDRRQVVLTSLVAPIGAQPVTVRPTCEHRGDRRAVVDRQDRATPDEASRIVDEPRSAVDQRRPRPEPSGGRKAARHRLDGCRQQLDEPTVGADVDEGLAPTGVEHGETKRQVVEQLVGDHHAVDPLLGHRRDGLDALRVTRALTRRHLDGNVAQRVAALGSGGEHRSGECAGPGTGVDDGEDVRSADPLPFGVEVPRHDGPEQRSDLGRRDEVATPAGRSPIRPRVETLRPVQRQFHEPFERNRPLRPNRVANLFSHPVLVNSCSDIRDQRVHENVGPQPEKAPVRASSAPTRATRFGSTPTAIVPMTVIASAATTGAGGLTGLTSPSGASSIQTTRSTRM